MPSNQFLENIDYRNKGSYLLVNTFVTDFLSAISHSIHLTISSIKDISVTDISTGMANINENVMKYINVKYAISTVKPAQMTTFIRQPLI